MNDDVIDAVELVARAVNGADNEWANMPKTDEHEPWDTYVARVVLSVPAVAEVIARDAKVRELAEDIVWLAKLAQGSSWPGEMADRVQRAADRVVLELGSDADRAAIAALYPEAGK